MHTKSYDKFQRGIREIFLSFQGGLWKMHRIYKKILYLDQGDFKILVKRCFLNFMAHFRDMWNFCFCLLCSRLISSLKQSILQTFALSDTRMAGCSSLIGSMSAWHASGPRFNPQVQQILSWRLGHEKVSTAILPLPLIQEEHLAVTGERLCTTGKLPRRLAQEQCG